MASGHFQPFQANREAFQPARGPLQGVRVTCHSFFGPPFGCRPYALLLSEGWFDAPRWAASSARCSARRRLRLWLILSRVSKLSRIPSGLPPRRPFCRDAWAFARLRLCPSRRAAIRRASAAAWSPEGTRSCFLSPVGSVGSGSMPPITARLAGKVKPAPHRCATSIVSATAKNK